jgi:cytochrome c oxidase subunit II
MWPHTSTRCVRTAARPVVIGGFALAVAACDGVQSTLAPHGPDARSIHTLGLLMYAGAALILLGVMALLACAATARREWRGWLAGRASIIAGGIVFPVVTLTALLIYELLVTRHSGAGGDNPWLRIEVIGEQFWWRVRYLDHDGQAFESANEIRIPVGRPVAFLLRSADVIHSFWIPSLGGKLDMIPGQVNTLQLTAEREGIYRGQCTEYCGAQHAKMAFYVVAERVEEFAAWIAEQRATAREPELPFLVQGKELFLSRGCGACHAVRGTPATGTLGPDLTHIGSRRSIGAGSLPNNIGTLAGWISSSQHLKPGNRMLSFDMLTGIELRGMAAYMESLK